LSRQFRLKVNSKLAALIEVLQWFEQISQGLISEKIISEKQAWQCQLALSEAFTNTVRHAHQHLPKTTPIDLEINVFSDYLEICIWDWGQPFNLQEKLNSLPQAYQNPLEKESDRGLLFMQELTDQLQSIRSDDQRNCLIMRKDLT
jgi:serine/threonine-protein kinase RsbW